MFSTRRRRFAAGSEDGATSTLSEEEPEQFAEMFSIFRIVAFYELLLHGAWQYQVRFVKTEKTELVLGMYIGAAFELIRFVCVLAIAIVLILLRISFLIPLTQASIIGNLSWITNVNSFAFWVALILCALIVVQFAVYQCKSPNNVVMATSFNFLFSVILIATLLHLVVLKNNNEAFVKEALHKIWSENFLAGLATEEAKGKKDSCCGIHGPADYWKPSYIMDYVNPLTNETVLIPNTRSYAFNAGRYYSLPVTCCKQAGHPGCSGRELTNEESQKAMEWQEKGYYDSLHTLFLQPDLNNYHSAGCLQKFTAQADHYATILIVTLVIFTIFTGLTIGFVIVLLLYQDSVGHMVSDTKMFGVERNTGVHFLMSLDAIDTDFQDDFSLIEFLRKTDMDKFMAEDRLKDAVKGRMEAEKM